MSIERYTIQVVVLVAATIAGAGHPAALGEEVPIAPIPGLTANTGEKPQSKVWTHDGTWWTCLPRQDGTWIWRLKSDDSWENVLCVSSAMDSHADVKPLGDFAHILLYRNQSAELVSIQSVNDAWQVWSWSPPLSLPGSETATIDIDSTGRLWLATDEGSSVKVYYSDSPYSSFSGSVELASGIEIDDITGVIALPNDTVGVMWSNQADGEFGFRLHHDHDGPKDWSANELSLGDPDDHINLAVASDSTLYAAFKTGSDTVGLFVREPDGTWHDYLVDEGDGTRGIVLLNEFTESIRVVYKTGSGDNQRIVYRDSSMFPDISFTSELPLIPPVPGGLNSPTSTKQNWLDELVVLASHDEPPPQEAPGILFLEPIPGACCLGDGSCFVETVTDCLIAGGTYWGVGTGCVRNPCPQPTGACCFCNGSCIVVTEAECNATPGGAYQGGDTHCSPDPCRPPLGACCFADGSCSESPGGPGCAGECEALGGIFQRVGTACVPNLCPQPCPADVNGDGSVDVQDLTEVILGWGGSGAADVNGDGSVDVQDLTEVVLAWGPC